jgi:hypothetical protein
VNGLEERYRRVLRLLPAAYRARWEEEMVDTFMLTTLPADLDPEQAEFAADYGRPSWPETWSVLTLAVRLRLGADESAGRSVAYGGALRLVALLGLLLLAAPIAYQTAGLLWVIHHLGQPDYAAPDWWQRLGMATGLLWAAAYLTLVTGIRRTGRVLAVLALALSLLSTLHNLLRGASTWYAVWNVYSGLLRALPVAALIAFHPTAPAVRSRPWLIALPVATVASTALIMFDVVFNTIYLDLPGLDDTLILASIGGYLLARRTGHVARTADWPLALAILAAANLALRVITLYGYRQDLQYAGMPHVLFAIGTAQTVLLVAAVLVLVPLARRDLAALPLAVP